MRETKTSFVQVLPFDLIWYDLMKKFVILIDFSNFKPITSIATIPIEHYETNEELLFVIEIEPDCIITKKLLGIVFHYRRDS